MADEFEVREVIVSRSLTTRERGHQIRNTWRAVPERCVSHSTILSSRIGTSNRCGFKEMLTDCIAAVHASSLQFFQIANIDELPKGIVGLHHRAVGPHD